MDADGERLVKLLRVVLMRLPQRHPFGCAGVRSRRIEYCDCWYGKAWRELHAITGETRDADAFTHRPRKRAAHA